MQTRASSNISTEIFAVMCVRARMRISSSQLRARVHTYGTNAARKNDEEIFCCSSPSSLAAARFTRPSSRCRRCRRQRHCWPVVVVVAAAAVVVAVSHIDDARSCRSPYAAAERNKKKNSNSSSSSRHLPRSALVARPYSSLVFLPKLAAAICLFVCAARARVIIERAQR